YDREYGVVANKIIQKQKYNSREWDAAENIHKDIKCDNILLHCPPGSGHVYAKISDFGFAKKEDANNEQTYIKGTIPYMKADIYSVGITFYRLLSHHYPVNKATIEQQRKKLAHLKCIDRPSEIKNDNLWDLISKLLEFDPVKRLSAAQALQHPFFTSPEAIADISKEQQKFANQL
ncbi:MAG: hypothetical protein EZS28_026393, partial [Streblomastix strix]